MKWIGQHIWDFISRFRSDVYLENIQDGTVDSDKFLGLDSNNKIVKETISAGLSITNASDNRVVTSTGGSGLNAESGFTYTSGTTFNCLSQSSTFSYAGPMSVDILNTANDDGGGVLSLHNARAAAGADNDTCGVINFYGSDEGGTTRTSFAQIVAQVADATEGQEAGRLEFKVQEYDGTATTGLMLDGDTDADGEIDVTIGAGAASTTRVAGDFLLGGDTITSNGDLNIVATGDDIDVDTDNFTITSSASVKPAFNLKTTIGSNKPSIFSFVKDKGVAGADGDYIGDIMFISDNDAQEQITFANINSQVRLAADGAEEGKLAINIKNTTHASSLQESLSLVSDGANTDVNLGYGASSTTTIAGTLTMGSTAFVNNSGVIQVATQGTIDHNSLASYSAAEHVRWSDDVSGSGASIHTNNIIDLHGAGVDGGANQLLTDDGDGTITSEPNLTWDGGMMIVRSATSGYPKLMIENTTVDNKPSNLSFYKNRSVGNGTADDYIGNITWDGKDASGNAQEYAMIQAQIVDPTHTDEAGMMQFKVASSTGTSTSGRVFLKGTGSNSDNDVDVDIGYGTTSMTTIAGDLRIGGLLEGAQYPHIMNCGFNATSTSKVYLPFSAGFYETTSPNSYTEYHTFVLPYNGYVDHVILRSEFAPGNTTVGVHTTDTNTEWPSTTADYTTTVDMAADDTPYKFSFGSGSTFTAGQTLVVSADVLSSITLGDCVATMVIRFDLTNGL